MRVHAVAVAFLMTIVIFAGLAGAAGEPTPVLDLDGGSFRAFLQFQTPQLVDADGKLSPLLEPLARGQKEADRKSTPIAKTDLPPANWAATDFDDSGWPRARSGAVVNQFLNGSIYSPGNPAELRRACVRGQFAVDDPAKVGKLTLSVTYYGGAVVYVNGKELTRGHLAAGQLNADSLGQVYPAEAYVRADGKRYSEGDDNNKEFAERLATRTRSLSGVAIPADLLRKGVNVIAIESLSSPINKLQVEAPLASKTWRGEPTPWPHAGVIAATLSSDAATGLTTASPDSSVRLTNYQPIESVQTWDFALPQESPGPIRLVGARNGSFSGQVALSSGQAIRNIKAAPTALAGPNGATIPAEAVRVRWAEPSKPEFSRNDSTRFERLVDSLPTEVQPAKVSIRGRKVQPAPAAVASIWVTVKVPASVAAGEYQGSLNLEAQDGSGQPVKFAVPVKLKVHDWTIPSPAEFTVRHNMFQSPESVALWHKVDLWSDKHFELVGQSLNMLGEIGNGLCILPLAENGCNLGNRQGMVRWVKQADGSFKHDYTILDRYLETYKASCPPPWIVGLYVWHYYKEGQKDVKPLSVTMVDTDGKISSMPQPMYGTPENTEFWRPVLTEVRKRLEKIGWFDRTAIVFTSYCYFPAKAVVEEYKSIWPDGKWMNCSHGNPSNWGGMPVPYSEWVWGCGRPYDPDRSPADQKYPSPWTAGTKRIELANPRVGQSLIRLLSENAPLSAFRNISEAAYQAGVRGIGHIGGDYWPVPIGPRGSYQVMCNTMYAVGMPNSVTMMTCPVEGGSVASTRYEMFREGIQTAEAIVFCQKAMLDKKVGGELADRINKALDGRARHYLRTQPSQPANWWLLEGSNWQQRDDELFGLAAEVAKAVGGK